MAKKKKTAAPATKPETPTAPENMVADMVVKYGKPALIGLVIVFAVGIYMAISGYEGGVDPKEAAAYAELDKYIGIVKDDPSAFYKQISDEDLKTMIVDLSSVASNHPGTYAAADAIYYRGMAYFHSAKYEEAAKSFTKFYTENGSRFPLAPLARLGAAKAQMSIGKKENVNEAIKILTEGREVVGNADFKNRFTYQIGICHVLLGNKTKALDELTLLAEGNDLADGSRPYRSQEAAALLPLIKKNDDAVLAQFLTSFPKELIKETPKTKKMDTAKPAAPKKAGS